MDGSIDASFNGGGKLTTAIGSKAQINSIAIQNDGKILAGGYSYNGSNRFTIARYNTDGSLDASFDGDGILTSIGGWINSLVIQLDGKIVVAGS